MSPKLIFFILLSALISSCAPPVISTATALSTATLSAKQASPTHAETPTIVVTATQEASLNNAEFLNTLTSGHESEDFAKQLTKFNEIHAVMKVSDKEYKTDIETLSFMKDTHGNWYIHVDMGKDIGILHDWDIRDFIFKDDDIWAGIFKFSKDTNTWSYNIDVDAHANPETDWPRLTVSDVSRDEWGKAFEWGYNHLIDPSGTIFASADLKTPWIYVDESRGPIPIQLAVGDVNHDGKSGFLNVSSFGSYPYSSGTPISFSGKGLAWMVDINKTMIPSSAKFPNGDIVFFPHLASKSMNQDPGFHGKYTEVSLLFGPLDYSKEYFDQYGKKIKVMGYSVVSYDPQSDADVFDDTIPPILFKGSAESNVREQLVNNAINGVVDSKGFRDNMWGLFTTIFKW